MFSAINGAMSGFRLKLVGMWLLDIITIISSIAFVFYSKRVIDIATSAYEGDLFEYAIILVVLLLFQISGQAYNKWYSLRIYSKIVNRLRSEYFDRILRSKWNEAEKFKTGDLQMRMMSDISDFVTLMVYTLPGMLRSFFELTGAFIFLYILNPMLAVSICVITPCFLIFSKSYFKKMREITHNIKEYDEIGRASCRERASSPA